MSHFELEKYKFKNLMTSNVNEKEIQIDPE